VTDPVSAETNACHVCGEQVAKPDQAAHLIARHPGPHVFHYDAREYQTDKPSMLVSELLALVKGEVTYSFYEERDGEHFYFSHGQAVDLTRDPWFYSVPPATF
jgi:hypothetical protein